MDASELNDFEHYERKFALPYLEGKANFRWLSDIRIDQSILVKRWWGLGRTYRTFKLPAFPEQAISTQAFIVNGRDGLNEDYLKVLCAYFDNQPDVFSQTLAAIEQARQWPVIASPTAASENLKFHSIGLSCLIKDERSPIQYFDIDLNGWNHDLHAYEDALKLVSKALRSNMIGPLIFSEKDEDNKPNYLFGDECMLEEALVRITYQDSLYGDLDENDNFSSYTILLEREAFLRSLQRTLEIMISQGRSLQKAWDSVFSMK
jgi:hypothetical protein